jgi:hypothetical protein
MSRLARAPEMKSALLAGALLCAASCGGDPLDAERACQRRLVGTFNTLPLAGGQDVSGTFASLRGRLLELEMKGCSEGQRHQIEAFARLAGRIAQVARRPGAVPTGARPATMLERQAMLELASLIEQFDRRRAVLAAETARMERDAR